MAKQLPGVILTARFVMPGSKTFGGYIEYMDRDAATRNKFAEEWDVYADPETLAESTAVAEDDKSQDYGGFNDYMGNPVKTDELFSRANDELTQDQKSNAKQYFRDAQKNGSPMWQLVFSFDNKWLEENGLLDANNQVLAKSKVMDATRKGIARLEEKTGLKGQWTAAIHYNTDNIHVHIGYTERVSTRPMINYENKKNPELSGWQRKGKFRVDALEQTKSAFATSLVSHKDLLMELDKSLSNAITHAREMGDQWQQETYQSAMTNLVRKLPSNRAQWQYGYASGQHFKTEIDSVINLYLKTDGARYMPEIWRTMSKVDAAYIRDYGETSRYYSAGKLYGKNGLYARLGNAVLKELKGIPADQLSKIKQGRNVIAQEHHEESRSQTREENLKTLQDKLKQIEQKYPNAKTPDAPTRRRPSPGDVVQQRAIAVNQQPKTMAELHRIQNQAKQQRGLSQVSAYRNTEEPRVDTPTQLAQLQRDMRQKSNRVRGGKNLSWEERMSRRQAYYASHRPQRSYARKLKNVLGKSTNDYLAEREYRRTEAQESKAQGFSENF